LSYESEAQAYLYALAGLVWMALPLVVLAQTSGLVPCGYGSGTIVSTNCQFCELAVLIQNIINFAIGISIPIAMLLFAYAGFLYATAGGGEKISKAHKVFSATGIGFAVALTGWLVVNTILNTLISGYMDNGSWFSIKCVQRNTQYGDLNQILNSIIPTVSFSARRQSGSTGSSRCWWGRSSGN